MDGRQIPRSSYLNISNLASISGHGCIQCQTTCPCPVLTDLDSPSCSSSCKITRTPTSSPWNGFSTSLTPSPPSWNKKASWCTPGPVRDSQFFFLTDTVGPLVIESLWTKNGVSTGALWAVNDPLVVQTQI